MLNKEDTLALAWEYSEGSGKRYIFTEENLFEFLKELTREPTPAQDEREYLHEVMDKLAIERYRVGSAGIGTLHRYAVRAGDGEQELYRGSESDCQNVARKLAGAFLDGGLALWNMIAAPIAQTAPQPEQSETVLVPVSVIEEAAHMLEAHSPGSGSVESFVAQDLRAALSTQGCEVGE